MSYVDGFVLPVPRKNLAAYRKMALQAGKVWMKYGALDYKECVLEDTKEHDFCTTFPKAFKPKKGEAVLFSYIVYKSRKHRDQVNKKIMNDPKMKDMCDPNDMPFNVKRMAYGGFKPLVDMKKRKAA